MYDPSEALLQLGLYDYVWGNPGLLQTYNANVQAEKARQEQLAYNNMWKQIEKDKLDAEKEKQKRIDKATAQAKVNQLLQGYGYKTPQERSLIDDQIVQAAIEGNLDMRDLDIQRRKSVNAAREEIAERSAKNAVLDPLKMEIRQHGLYSSEPDWKGMSKDKIKDIQQLIGVKADGVVGPKTKEAIAKWNAEHPDKQISPENPLQSILGKIDNLNYTYNGESRSFSPAELDELRKLVYNGEDPSVTSRQSWENWGRSQAQNEATKRREAEAEKQKKIEEIKRKQAAGYPLWPEEKKLLEGK